MSRAGCVAKTRQPYRARSATDWIEIRCGDTQWPHRARGDWMMVCWSVMMSPMAPSRAGRLQTWRRGVLIYLYGSIARGATSPRPLLLRTRPPSCGPGPPPADPAPSCGPGPLLRTRPPSCGPDRPPPADPTSCGPDRGPDLLRTRPPPADPTPTPSCGPDHPDPLLRTRPRYGEPTG